MKEGAWDTNENVSKVSASVLVETAESPRQERRNSPSSHADLAGCGGDAEWDSPWKVKTRMRCAFTTCSRSRQHWQVSLRVSASVAGGRSGEDVYIGIQTVPWARGRPSKSHFHRPTISTEAEGSTTRRPYAIRRPVPHQLERGRLKSHGQRQRVQLPRKGHARRAFVDACRRLDLPLKQVTQAVVESLWRR